MVKVKQLWCELLRNPDMYINMLIAVFIIFPLCYILYLQMSAMMLATDIMTLIEKNNQEGVNIIVNFTALYAAFTMHKYKKDMRQKNAIVSFGLILFAQVFFLNMVTFIMMVFYIRHYIGWRNMKVYYCNAEACRNIPMFFCAMMVFMISIVTLWLKLKMGML